MSGKVTDNIGRSSGLIKAASGGGAVTWVTDSIKTSTFTAAAGKGYFCNTTSGAFQVNLPAGTVGDIIGVADYASTFQTNNLTVAANGTEKMNGVDADPILSTQGVTIIFIYVDATKGWKSIQGSDADITGDAYVAASGGTLTTAGDYKTHVFTGDGPFNVTNAGVPAGSATVDYMVVAGGGGGGASAGGGGGGAGGFREGNNPASYTASPLSASGIAVSVQDYSIDVGGGGAGGSGANGTQGSSSTFGSITSAGGGYGGGASPYVGGAGGSGGGGGFRPSKAGGAGNTPSTSPAQGTAGGATHSDSSNPDRGGGGGGATVAGTTPSSTTSGPGGTGATTNITASPVAYAGGGGGGKDEDPPHSGASGEGGTGGGGRGASSCPNSSRAGAVGTANTGGGGGGGGAGSYPTGYAGGSGIVVIRYKYQN